MCGTERGPDAGVELGAQRAADEGTETFSALLEDSAEDLYENAPCGYLSTLLDGHIAKINTTLLNWLGYRREELVGKCRFSELLSVGGRMYYETHFAPLLRLQGEVNAVALELMTAGRGRLPVLVTAATRTGSDGQPLLIRITVTDASERRAYERELLRARREADDEGERLRRLVTTLQGTLLPPVLSAVPGLQVAAHYHLASPDHVGGDFYDLFPLAGGRRGFFLGDVCGKGATAAVVTSLARYTLRSAAVFDPDPVAVLSNLNAVLWQEYEHDDPRFCTVLFGVLTPLEQGCAVTMATGGHPPALVLRADGTARYLPTEGGQLVGALPDARFATVTLRLSPGDTLMLYSDGLTEARTDEARSRYGEEALLAFAAGLAPIPAPRLVDEVTALLARFGEGLDDDTAVLALSVQGGEPR